MIFFTKPKPLRDASQIDTVLQRPLNRPSYSLHINRLRTKQLSFSPLARRATKSSGDDVVIKSQMENIQTAGTKVLSVSDETFYTAKIARVCTMFFTNPKPIRDALDTLFPRVPLNSPSYSLHINRLDFEPNSFLFHRNSRLKTISLSSTTSVKVHRMCKKH